MNELKQVVHMADNPVKNHEVVDFTIAFALMISLVAGAAGGGLVACHKILRGRNVTLLIAMAYVVVGAVLSIAAISYMLAFRNTAFSFPEIVFYGLIAGAFGSSALAAVHLFGKFSMKRAGIEMEVNIKQLDDKED